MKKGPPANVYTKNSGYIFCNVGKNKRLRNHSFTLELEFSGLTPENPNRAIFRKRAWLEDAHTYDYWGPQTFNCTGEQSSGGSFQAYSANEAWILPKPKHVEFKGSLDQVISNIDTTGGAFLIKVRKNGMFADNCLIPDLKVAAYHGEVSLDWKVLFSILFKELETGQQIRERPEICNSISEMILARPLCPFSKLLGPPTHCCCNED